MDFLSIGHSCDDRLGGKNILGGTASYASLVARQLGMGTGILTSVGKDFEFLEVFEKRGIQFWNKPAVETTVFENIYLNGKRTQHLHARAETLFADDVPAECLTANIVLFCPIANEVDSSIFKKFPDALKGATIQGWLRKWNEKGKISPKEMDWSQLATADVVIMSDTDIQGFEAMIPQIASLVEVLVMTQGANGAQVFYRNKKFHFPACPVAEVDATGAGDVFATAFLVKYAKTRDIYRSTGFAHAAASFVVQGIGITNLASVEQINDRFEQYKTHPSLSL